MKTFHSYQEFKSQKKTIITIGTFDGVHYGHQSIIKKLNDHNGEYESVLMTFFPHPRMVLRSNPEIKLLNTIKEKSKLLEALGLENLIIQPFNLEFSQLSARDFVKKILVDALHIHKIIIGYDHRFGINRSANISDLIRFGEEFGFEVEQISAQEIEDVSVSSTKIRKALSSGDVALANQYLGQPYPITGTVVHGKGLGKTINYPTANIKIKENYKLIPANGVYIIYSVFNNIKVYGMMNIGTNPTVDGTQQSIEVNYFDWNKDLYDQEVTVYFLKYIRAEQRFKSIKALQEQLAIDKQATLNYLLTIKNN
ncbi:MAG: bifunctional riboflavin kinase/FAD synthetase [Flavobacteriales bacterium]|nr:bifunctional riboflavin kinase/FAD synthetase [Flavobacteriales bacterium]